VLQSGERERLVVDSQKQIKSLQERSILFARRTRNISKDKDKLLWWSLPEKFRHRWLERHTFAEEIGIDRRVWRHMMRSRSIRADDNGDSASAAATFQAGLHDHALTRVCPFATRVYIGRSTFHGTLLKKT
jgi:hypothetical protein